MKQKKKIFSYNTKKHPIVDRFLNDIESGMHSHYIRKAIEFYVENHDNIRVFSNKKNSFIQKNDMDKKIFDSILWYLSKY